MKRPILSAMAGLLFIANGLAQSQPIPVDPAVRIGKLGNGLTYYIRHNAEPQGQANFYIAQKVGSILEEENQRGLAHFLEHMCFNGTKHFPGNGVIKYCESIGVKFGYNLNAYTSIDETVYNIDNVPMAATPSAIDSCLWILHDWADDLLLTDEDIDHERGVIHEEWRTRANAQIRQIEQLLPMMYPVGMEHARPDGSNRYGHRMPIGLMEVVDNFPYKALRDYYEQWYRPDLQAIVVVGDVDVNAIEAKIKDIFGTIAKPVNPTERYYVQIPDNDEPLICMVKDKEQPQAMTFLFCKHDPYPEQMRGDVNYLVFKYALNAASRMINARLQELLQSANPPFISAEVEDGDFFISRMKQSFGGQVVSSETDFLNATTTLYREILRAVRCGFNDSEYERVKAQMLADAEAAYNSRDKKKSADFCKEYVKHFISNEPIPSIENDYAMTQQIASAINADIFRQTDFNANEVLMTAVSHGGTSLYPTSMSADIKALNEVMTVGGVGKFSMTELRKVLAGRKVSITPNVGLFAEYINAKATPKDLETMLQLNYLYFTALRSDREAYDSWLNRQRASLANLEKDPNTALRDSIQTSVYTDASFIMGLHPADLDRLDYDRIMLQIARERFANAADFDFIITGAIDEETLLPLIELYIASLPASGKREKANLKATDFRQGQHSNVFNRQMEVPMVTNVFFDSSKAKFTLKNKLAFDLALNALSVVLLEEIREKEGGTYSIGAYGDLVANPSPRVQAYMQIPYQASPDKYEYLNQRVRDIVAQFVTEGPSAENLAKGKEYFLKNHNENLRENSYWATALETYLDTKVDITRDFEQTLQGITADDARRAIEQLMKQKNHTEVIMVGVEK